MMAIALEPGDSWQGISAKVTSFKSNSRWHRQMSRIVSSTAASMPDWYSELGSFAGFHLNTSLDTLLTDNKLRTLCRSSRPQSLLRKTMFAESIVLSTATLNVLRESP